MSADSLDTVFQDSYLMVINKPPNLVVTPAESHKEPTLAEILEDEYDISASRGGVVHRLDKDTSGLILIAKTEEILEKLQLQFKERTVSKEYICLVHGLVENGGVVDGAIDRNPKNREKFIVMEGGKEAKTFYEPTKYYELAEETEQLLFTGLNKNQQRRVDRSGYGLFTQVLCKPQTGRTHQIRVHLKHIGFSLVGDSRYGGRRTSKLDAKWCPRQFLHASSIKFTHPVTGEHLHFEAPLPEDLQLALKNLKSYHK
jgi:23S rRNA pseudouridine1911/1915/1917 synthase